MNSIMVACDLHDKTMVLKIAQGRGRPESLTMNHNQPGRQKLIAMLKTRAAGGARVIFAYEASGLGFGLHDELRSAGVECHVLAPTRIARSVRHGRAKTDDRDAEQILEILRGHVLAGNPLPDVWIPDLQTRDDREVVRTRLDLAEKLAAVKTQVRCLLKRHPRFRPEGAKATWTRAYRGWLERLTHDESVAAGQRATLASLLRQYEFLEEEIHRFERVELRRLAESPRYQRPVRELMKLAGVGLLSALVFVTELGDPRRFANRRQVGSYLGLVPASYESGSRSDCKGHITRQGSTRVRKVLCQAAWARVRSEGPDEATYQALVAKNPKHKKIAVVAIMRRLGIRMWHVFRDAWSEPEPCEVVRRPADLAPAG